MKKECAGCHEEYTNKFYGPFCSGRCEELFHEYAPVELIDRVYKQYEKKHEKEMQTNWV